MQALVLCHQYKHVIIIDILPIVVYGYVWDTLMNKPDVFYKQVGENIRARRKALGLSQEALAKAVGLKRPSLSNIEKGRQNILLHTFYDIADSLNMGAETLLPARQTSQPTDLPDLTNFSREVREFVEAAIKPAEKGETNGHQTTQD